MNIFMEQRTICPHCGGSGQVLRNPCKHCGGMGVETVEQELTIDIPIGAREDAYINYPGMGNVSAQNPNVAGDLYVFFHFVEELGWNVMPGRPFDLMKVVEVPIITCILGGEVETQSFTGETIKFNVRQGATDGSVVTVPGQGLPMESGRGNGIIEVRHKFPNKIDKDEKELLERLAKKRNFKK